MSDHSSEDEYFARLDREKTAALKAKLDQDGSAKAADELRVLHHHRCGKCGNPMETKPFRGVEIEVCPSCGAVLLDRGELESLAGDDSTGTFRVLFSMFGVE